jgi:hypothetical protein
MSQPLHHGPILPLAIMAMFALMIPTASMLNRVQEAREANAMRLTLPTNEPVYEAVELTVEPTQSPTPTNSPKPLKNPKSQGYMNR